MDFCEIKRRTVKKDKIDIVEVYPSFRVCRSKDLMVRGGKFYAVWNEQDGLWSTDEYDVQRFIDEELYASAESLRMAENVSVKTMSDFSSRSWVEFRKYISNISDNSHQLDENLTFANTEVKKSDYVSKRLPYSLVEGPCEAFEEIISTLYDPDQRAKLEWAIGAVVSGEAKDIQKFLVLYGEVGAGKSTILNIVQKLFEGYYTTFEAKALASSTNIFATEVFQDNPLVAIQHDGDLSKIEDNTKLNSIVSHEEMTMNVKHKSSFTSRINAFLFMGTNKPVKITDAKSGIIRRLIDVKPSGRKIPTKRYFALMSQIDFELGAIAKHCLDVYHEMGKNFYASYKPLDMMFKTNVFFNFVEDSFDVFKEQDGVSLKQAYTMYKVYCDESGADFKLPMYKFREELKNYFNHFDELKRVDGKQIRSYYSGFITSKFSRDLNHDEGSPYSISFDYDESIFDEVCAECPAQYATKTETPKKKWEYVKTRLEDIDTHELHYVRVPENHIVIDFDIKDESGEKSFDLNMEAASKWPSTYGEISKGGKGIHLHYIYDGDVNELSRVYSDGIEIKVFTGNSSLRRKLTKCNNVPIATIKSGLPFKEKKKVVNFDSVMTEKSIRKLIRRNLNKEIHPGTKPSIDFIDKILSDAYNSGVHYDVTDMRPTILAFANNSTNKAEYCVELVSKMKFKSDTPSDAKDYDEDTLVFFDVEVFPNLFLINWKFTGADKACVRMVNPTPEEVGELFKFKLVGFNCRRYDNHILYARYIGYNNEQLYEQSKRIIENSPNAMFGEAYNISYTDVYDFASAEHKKSLKKFEIELGIHHQELGLPWDQPVPEDQWIQVAEYCDNDVIATEEVFNYLSADWTARQILADLAGMTVNDTTNQLTTRIIFEGNKKPQSQFNYRNLADPIPFEDLTKDTLDFLQNACPIMMKKPFFPIFGDDKEDASIMSALPYFPGYKFYRGKSTYRGEEVGEGGYVYAEPGMYSNVALLDITSMHPHSVIAECLFGVEYTTRFKEIVDGRVDIKHEDWSATDNILGGKLKPYIKKVKDGKLTSKDLANALKTAINSIYGMTSSKYDFAFKDPRNKDNIVAKRGALFMIDLKNAVQEQGFTVAHIKTDSIKIPDATPEIIDFVMEFGEKYGYHFEHEATYEKMCLVNNAVYIAKYADKKDHPWVAVGAQFQHPYVFKTLFSKDEINFQDLCETKNVKSALYLDMNEDLGEDEHEYVFIGKTGSFCPIKEGCGGGVLLREQGDKYNSATGAKGYRWLESEMVDKLDKKDDIDYTYFDKLVEEAIKDISEFGNFDWLVSDVPLSEVPFDGPYVEATKKKEGKNGK